MDAQGNAARIAELYAALGRRDGAAMEALYHPEARFRDPAFGELQGPEVGRMWRMLTARGKDLEVSASGIQATGETGQARWEARYTFGATGRPVHNRIQARFRFADGLIVEHEDTFSLARWCRMALGPTGWLLGWTPWLQGKVRAQARTGLARWQD